MNPTCTRRRRPSGPPRKICSRSCPLRSEGRGRGIGRVERFAHGYHAEDGEKRRITHDTVMAMPEAAEADLLHLVHAGYARVDDRCAPRSDVAPTVPPSRVSTVIQSMVLG